MIRYDDAYQFARDHQYEISQFHSVHDRAAVEFAGFVTGYDVRKNQKTLDFLWDLFKKTIGYAGG